MVTVIAIKVPSEAKFTDEARKLGEAIAAPSGLLIAIPGADDAVAEFLEAAAWQQAGPDGGADGPFSRKIAGLMGVAAGRSGDLAVVEQVWDLMTEAGALVLPGAVVVDGTGGAFMDDGTPRNARHRDSAREVGASVARLIRRMGLGGRVPVS
jgi:NAD(P)H-dependent FMN reductase